MGSMKSKACYFVSLIGYVTAVFQITDHHFWIGMASMMIASCFLTAGKRFDKKG